MVSCETYIVSDYCMKILIVTIVNVFRKDRSSSFHVTSLADIFSTTVLERSIEQDDERLSRFDAFQLPIAVLEIRIGNIESSQTFDLTSRSGLC